MSSSSTRRRRLLVFAGLVVFAGAVVVAGGLAGSDDAEERVAPTFSVPAVREGEPAVELAAFDDRPVVLNFFAAWCAPCRKELPLLEAASRRLAGEVAFVGIDTRDSRSQAIDLMDEVDMTFPAGYDPDGKVAEAYRLRGMPTTFFLAPGGVIVEEAPGELDEERLEAGIRQILEES